MRTGAEKQTGKKGQRGTVETGSIGSPISNEAYNVIAALHEKLEGLEAYRKYAKDGNPRVWKELSNADVECTAKLVEELERIVKAGKLRMHEPGDTRH